MESSSHSDIAPVVSVVAEDPSTVVRTTYSTNIDRPSSVIDILSMPGGPTIDFSDPEGEDQVDEAPLMGEVGIAQLKDQCDIPHFADIVLARSGDKVHVDCRGYCIFYAYPFKIGFRLSLPMLVVDFCRYYRVCPVHLVPSCYELLAMLIKYAKFARIEITLGHVLTLYAPHRPS